MPNGGHPYEGRGGKGSYDCGKGDGCRKGVGSSHRGYSKGDFGSKGCYVKSYDSNKGDGCGKGVGSGDKGYS